MTNALSGIFAATFVLAYLALIVFIVWQVISALHRIARSAEDVALTLRRMELNWNRVNRPPIS